MKRGLELIMIGLMFFAIYWTSSILWLSGNVNDYQDHHATHYTEKTVTFLQVPVVTSRSFVPQPAYMDHVHVLWISTTVGGIMFLTLFVVAWKRLQNSR